MGNCVKFLEWDSNFFGRKIGALTLEGGESIKDIDSLCSKFDTVYLFSRDEIALPTSHYRLVDRKIIYIMKKPAIKLSNSNVREYHGEPGLLYDIAFQAGHKSRFKVDPAFTDKEFRNLYRTWIDNSINGVVSDFVFVFIDNENVPKGLITAKTKEDKLVIGLFATDESARGLGVGSALINEVISRAAELKITVEVTTQSDNLTACQFYEHRGFNVKEQMYVYHYCKCLKV